MKLYIIPWLIIGSSIAGACEREVNLGFPPEKDDSAANTDSSENDTGTDTETDTGKGSEIDSDISVSSGMKRHFVDVKTRFCSQTGSIRIVGRG
ncbi:MAG: hypothetical protein JXX14_11160 [Deltaproteobacteria bacterium]|nr:hypothetical protein [Deltaproteobacteria bacterium]